MHSSAKLNGMPETESVFLFKGKMFLGNNGRLGLID